jgi:DNA-binding transcriptional ArsR family regulator
MTIPKIDPAIERKIHELSIRSMEREKEIMREIGIPEDLSDKASHEITEFVAESVEAIGALPGTIQDMAMDLLTEKLGNLACVEEMLLANPEDMASCTALGRELIRSHLEKLEDAGLIPAEVTAVMLTVQALQDKASKMAISLPPKIPIILLARNQIAAMMAGYRQLLGTGN